MTFTEMAEIMDAMPELKGLYRSRTYEEEITRNEHKKAICSIYIESYGAFKGPTWDVVMALIKDEFTPTFTTDGQPE